MSEKSGFLGNIPLRTKNKVAITFILMMLLAAGVMTQAEGDDTPKPEAAAAMTVSIASPQQADWAETVTGSGAIAAWQEASIGSEINGQRLIELNVNVGDKVTKGQVLARFNKETLLAQQAELQAAYQKAESDRTRAVKMKDTDAMSAQQITAYVTQAKIAKAQLDAKDIEIRNADIIAPDDGTISARTASMGMVASVGQELFRLICQDRLEWRGQFTAAQMTRVKPDQAVTLTLPDRRTVDAKVRQVAPSLDDASRMGTVYADLPIGSSALAGMYATGDIAFDRTTAVIVPAKSVVIRDGQNYVFKLDKNTGRAKVAMAQVTVGRHRDDKAEILTGVEQQDVLAVDGAGFLNDGDIVQITNDTVASNAAGK